jgi:maltooligosyltrehalose trehalohydrolase
LDVVYNHFGSVGERLLRPFSEDYFSKRYECEWGSAINFDDRDSAAVREFILANVEMWIAEYHFDGLRIDATQAFHDASPTNILREITQRARQSTHRDVLVVGESEPQQVELLRAADAGGCEFDAIWNDDFHHAALVRLTGHREAYYTDYRGTADEFVAAARFGFLFQGQRYAWQDKPRGSPAMDVRPRQFIHYLENHDQVANSPRGQRLRGLTSPGRYRAMTALLLLGPQTPLLFQGQEFAAQSPFLYFNDAPPAEADSVRAGRAKFLSQFRSLATPPMQASLPDPCDVVNFERCRLDFSERQKHAEVYALHRDLLALRRQDAVLGHLDDARVDGAAIDRDVFLLRYFGPGGQTRLLVINFGGDAHFDSIAHPLVAPPAEERWVILWSSEDRRYGGHGVTEADTAKGWQLSGESAILLHPLPRDRNDGT